MTIIDTSVMIPFLKGAPKAVEKVRDVQDSEGDVAVTVITVYEMLKGAYLSSRLEDNLKDVNEAISNMHVLDLTPQACEEASRIFCELKKSGKIISEFDILIAAIAKTNRQALLTYDQHFRSVKGIDLIQW